ncbi:hypothetical protein OIN60_04705 [Paenibacillus sp. P96]|uniref:FHA domain-containing protein n=1 Tax=Paenibacillus zeirhizosphaerae TaxID=2987519 RepID=A0ABT9FMW2_9BACL|nr:hypothetical protein [Paenibacillus sp. P96]MDP4096067.1 hypothetical protein [Paenibacillus sp. P96]
MKSSYKAVLAAFLVGGGILAGTVMNNTVNGASGGQPGTADDPVVTKSYVDEQIAKALGGAVPSNTSDPQSGPKEEPAGTAPVANAPTDNTSSAANNEVKIVELTPGKKLIAKAGAEFIVRNGYASVYSMDASGAIDITEGKEIFHNQTVQNNHLLSFPRDGRGIQVQEGQTYKLTVMVRGGYTVQ